MAANPSATEGIASRTRRRKAAWLAALLCPLLLGPLWLWLWRSNVGAPSQFQTLAGLVVLLLTTVCAYCDLRWHRIPNWATYTAALWGLGINVGGAWLATSGPPAWLGAVGAQQSLAGFGVLLLVLLVVFSFTGGGAGDVKLAASLGALFGLDRGVDAVAYSFIVAGGCILAWAVWQFGPVAILKVGWRSARRVFGSLPADDDPDQLRIFHRSLPLAPFFCAGALLVLFEAPLSGWLEHFR